jgi:deazaflavin-dependent oxidoreductase (nitroreductase family)
LVLAILGPGTPAAAQELVIPNALSIAEGNGATIVPLSTGLAPSSRFQQVYLATQFPAPVTIYAISFRPDGEGVLLVASQGGAPRNPVWYNNLVKHPDIEVTHRGRHMKLRARLAAPAEKLALWPICDEHYAPFAEYRTRTTREIPIFVCEPRAN